MRLIDADEIRWVEHHDADGNLSSYKIAFSDEMPPVIEERKTGRWINGKCNQCGGHAPYWPMASTYYESDFCPLCGAKMEPKQTLSEVDNDTAYGGLMSAT